MSRKSTFVKYKLQKTHNIPKPIKVYLTLLILFIIFLMVIWYCLHLYLSPLVSVVMPVYNRQDLVPKAIDSILKQTFKDFEFIIIDDGSTDSTLSILEKFAKQDTRIKILINPENKGIAYSRQRGMDAAKGKYIAIMDSDDWSVPDRLEKSVSFMSDHPEIVAMTGTIKDLKDCDTQKIKPDGKHYTPFLRPGYYEIELAFYNIFPNVASMFRHDFIIKNNISYDFTITSGEDYDFWRQIIMAGGRLGSISDVLVYVRFHYTNPENYYSAMYRTSLEVHKKMFSLFFEPTSDELKLTYSLKEKCALLNKMKQANLLNPKMPQDWLDKRYTDSCPDNFEHSLFLTHPYWSDSIYFLSNNRIKRNSSGDTGKIIKKDDTIVIQWDHWGTETFKQTEGDHYILDQ